MRLLFIIFITVGSFAPLLSGAQDKVTGLGPFKIGKTLSSQIPSFADTSNGRLYHAVPNNAFTDLWYAGYYPMPGVWVEDLELSFFHDTLYSIKCKMTDSLNKAISLKYGQGRLSVTEKPVKCITGLKIEYYEKEQRFVTEYPASKNLSATALRGLWYNDKCEKQYISMFLVKNYVIEGKVDALVKNYEDRKSDAAKKEAKSKLSGL